ncbi:MAG: hypothetical protein GY861_16090 [bacterium]|nr:hypothetical protein [bacterium]
MPNKHFCQGPTCHEQTTQDRFLKSRGVVRGRYASLTMNHDATYYKRSRYFCSQRCESQWLNEHMENIEQGRPIEFIRHRRESGGYAKVVETSEYNPDYKWSTIKRVDNRTEID